jgi:hypothetical protein
MGLGKAKKTWTVSLLPRMTLTAAVAVSKYLGMRKMSA